MRGAATGTFDRMSVAGLSDLSVASQSHLSVAGFQSDQSVAGLQFDQSVVGLKGQSDPACNLTCRQVSVT